MESDEDFQVRAVDAIVCTAPAVFSFSHPEFGTGDESAPRRARGA